MVMKGSNEQKDVKGEGIRNEGESVEETGLPMIGFFL